MPFTVMLSPDAKEYLDSLDDKRARNIRKHLKELYRLRMGEFRAVFFVEEQAVFVTDLFPKKRDSAYRQN